jgi:hypothetical protein
MGSRPPIPVQQGKTAPPLPKKAPDEAALKADAAAKDRQKPSNSKMILVAGIAVLVLALITTAIVLIVMGLTGTPEEPQIADLPAPQNTPVEPLAAEQPPTPEQPDPEAEAMADFLAQLQAGDSTQAASKTVEIVSSQEDELIEPAAQAVTIRMGDETQLRAPQPERATRNPIIIDWMNSTQVRGLTSRRVQLDETVYVPGDLVLEEPELRLLLIDKQLGLLIFEDALGTRYEKDYDNL